MELTAQKRTVFGRAVKSLRRQGVIPAELYGNGIQNEHLAVALGEFRRVFRHAGENTVVQLRFGDKEQPVLIYDVVLDPVTDEPTAVDFYAVRLDTKIRVKVPFVFVGQAPAVKDKGGVLVKTVQEIAVEALPGDIPHAINVSIESLHEIGTSVCVKDISVPSGVRVMVDPETVVVSVIEKLSEEKEQAMAAQVDVGTIKAEVEEKKAERAEAETKAAPQGVPPAGGETKK